jgi:glycyl-tRNA synthetase beta chain
VNIQDFVFEIRTEEIPAPALLPARLELSRRLSDALAEEGLTPAATESYATPRRLAVVLRGLPEQQEDRSS